MPIFLHRRAQDLTERMESPSCDRRQLHNTYRQFHAINRMVSGWRRVYRRQIRPLALPGRPLTLLDIGFGGGDIPFSLQRWAQDDGLDLEITATDTDRRALEYVATLDYPPGLTFLAEPAQELLRRGQRFDVVISNALLHHLPQAELPDLCDTTRQLARRLVLHNDIERGDLAYLFFKGAIGPFFRDSFITADGLTSIRRSYTHGELKRAKPSGWELERLFPYRQLLIHRHPETRP